MANTAVVIPEVWPVAADRHGLWLISGAGPLRAAVPVMADEDVHANAELELMQHSVRLGDVMLLHSTSWRSDGSAIVLAYIAAVRCPGPVLESWPTALPISPLLPGEVGRPQSHGAADPPLPRFVDCLLHAVRHLAFLRDWDASAAAALDDHWLSQLDGIRPALAGMYREAAR
jgi:hypothetical protein